MLESVNIGQLVWAFIIPLILMVIKYGFDTLAKSHERIKAKIEAIKLVDSIINNRSWEDKKNRMIVEEAFQQLHKYPICFEEIKILLYAKNSSKAFKTYLKYRSHIEFNKSKTKFTYKKGKRPYWNGIRILSIYKIRLPKSIILGYMRSLPIMIIAVFFLAKALEYKGFHPESAFFFFSPIWALLFFMVSLGVLFSGVKYQSSEFDIVAAMPDIFELENHSESTEIIEDSTD